MAQLDQLIGAMYKHAAEAVTIAHGEQPALVISGTSRPVSKGALDASQVLRLVAEVAPASQRDAVAAGVETVFAYETGGTTVQVELVDGPRVTIRPQAAAPIPDTAADVSTSTPAPASEAAPPTPRPATFTGELHIDQLFGELVRTGGSDLHLCTGNQPMLRVDGELVAIEGTPVLDDARAEKLLLHIAPERNRTEFAERGDTDFAYEIEGLARFRCNLFRDRKGAGGVFRVIPTKILTADQLGLSPFIQGLAQLTKGLVLVTGPTGSGKSTTLAAVLDLVNASRSEHIITIEDPIEFVHPNKQCLVNQREVHLHTQSFKAALRAALREDPDIVLVGELRDLETVAIAIETAETGHLVFGTLHTNSAVSTVDRIIDQFPGDEQERIRVMLSESLKAVIAQVLLKKIGGGRVAAQEVLMVNPAISNLIREGKTFQIPSIMQTGRKIGMLTMSDALVELVQKKLVEPREAYFKAVDKASLLTAFRSKRIPTDFVEGG